MKNTITLAGKEYELKLGVSSLALYEQVTGHSFAGIEGFQQGRVMLYCILTARKQTGFRMTFDEFAETFDDLELFKEFFQWLTLEWARQAEMIPGALGGTADTEEKKN